MVKITFKEAQFMNYKNVKIQLTEDGLEYYRPEIPVFVVVVWKDDDYSEKEFKTLKQAQKYVIKNRFLDSEINCYHDIADRYWYKQYHYVKQILMDVEEQ